MMVSGLAQLALAAAAAEPTSGVGSGTISGGWSYVWASWSITWAMIIAYGLYLWARRPGAPRDEG